MKIKGFWRELNDDYYKTFPDLWEEGDLYADGPEFIQILNGDAKTFKRRLASDERIADEAIWRADRKIWRVGRKYKVRAEPWKGPALGEIRLISIESIQAGFWAILTFEVVN